MQIAKTGTCASRYASCTDFPHCISAITGVAAILNVDGYGQNQEDHHRQYRSGSNTRAPYGHDRNAGLRVHLRARWLGHAVAGRRCTESTGDPAPTCFHLSASTRIFAKERGTGRDRRAGKLRHRHPAGSAAGHPACRRHHTRAATHPRGVSQGQAYSSGPQQRRHQRRHAIRS